MEDFAMCKATMEDEFLGPKLVLNILDKEMIEDILIDNKLINRFKKQTCNPKQSQT